MLDRITSSARRVARLVSLACGASLLVVAFATATG